jgi:DNA polymerase-1
MACKRPNMQQLPRSYKRCVKAPPGRCLVSCDWAALHLRIVAGVAPEPAFAEAFKTGEDLHRRTAKLLTGKDDPSKEDRQKAKGANFGFIYGLGTATFQARCKSAYNLEVSIEEATAFRDKFRRAYLGVRAWQLKQRNNEAITIRIPSGRRCNNVMFLPKQTSYTAMMIEADCLRAALALVWQCRDEVPGAFPVLATHDAVCVECDESDARKVMDWLAGIMNEAAQPFLGDVPSAVGASAGTTWGGEEIIKETVYPRGQS